MDNKNTIQILTDAEKKSNELYKKKELIKQLEDVEIEQYIQWLSYNNKRTHNLLEKDTQDIYEDTYSLENGKYI